MTVPPGPALPAEPRADGSGVVLRLRVQPGARREGIEGTVTEADGTVRLKVALTVAAEGGKANARLIALLARRWKFPKGAFAISAGEKDRRKTMLVAGDSATILARIAAECEAAGRKGT
jgi:uncharacterized protein (TIGR00251 family)